MHKVLAIVLNVYPVIQSCQAHSSNNAKLTTKSFLGVSNLLFFGHLHWQLEVGLHKCFKENIFNILTNSHNNGLG